MRRRCRRPASRGPARRGRRSSDSVASVRSGWPAPSSAISTGVDSPAASSRISSATSSAGGLETSTISSTAGSASSRRDRLAGRQPADLGAEVAAADAQRRGDPDAGVVEQREQLLAAGAGRGDDADRPGRDDVGEAQPDAVEDGGPAVGSHDEQAALGGVPLERELLLDRHVVAEDHHVAAGLERVHGLDERRRAGHRDQRDRTGGWAGSAAQRAGRRARRRLLGRARVAAAGAAPARRRPRPGRRPGRRRRRAGSRRPCRWVRPRPARRSPSR